MEDLKREQQHERELKKIGLDSEEKPNAEGTKPNTTSPDEGMAPPPSDPGSVQMPQGGPPTAPGLPPERTNLDAELAGSNGDANYAAIGENLRNESNIGNVG